MKRHIIVILYVSCLFALLIQGTLWAQSTSVSAVKGLPNSMVHQVIEDEEGFMWMATYYGLYRYDGWEFLPYKNNPAQPSLLPSNNVVSIAASDNRYIWIGTHNGLCRLDKRSGQVSTCHMEGVVRKRINHLLRTQNGELYAATICGLARLDPQTDSLGLLCKERENSINMQFLCEDTNGDILIATWGNGICRYKTKQKKLIRYERPDGEKYFRSIFRDSKGNIWTIAHGGGLYALTFTADKAQMKWINIRPSNWTGCRDDDYVLSINEEKCEQQLWLGTRHGVVMANLPDEGVMPREWVRLEAPFPQTEVLHIYPDSHSTLWLSTKGAGVWKVSAQNRLFKAIPSIHDRPGESRVASIVTDEEDAIWIAADYGVTYRDSLGMRELLPDLRSNHLVAVSQPTSGVWVSTNGDGLYFCRKGHTEFKMNTHNTPYLPHNLVYMAAEDSVGQLWIATYEGLAVRRADGSGMALRKADGWPEALKAEFTALCFDIDGSAWLASPTEGVVHVVGDINAPKTLRVAVYNLKNGGLPVESPLCLYITRDGRVWAGTEGGGLCVLHSDEGRFVSVHARYQLPGDMVTSILQDAWGHLWIGTNQGLACLDLHPGGEQVRIYTESDGLPDNFCEPNAATQSRGVCYFGTSQGTVSFTPPERYTGWMPQVVVTHAAIDGTPYDEALPACRMTIPSRAQSFALTFAALTYESQPHAIYAYRLTGFDTDWRYQRGTDRTVSYTNLSAGKYTFEVKTRNDDGRWSEAKSIDIEVLPHWYATWWAYSLYLLVAAGVLAHLISEVRRRMMLRNRLHWNVTDGDLTVSVVHKEAQTDDMQQKRQLSFEIKQLDYTDEDEQFLLRAIDCVNQHLSDVEFGSSQLTEAMAMSRSSLFKKLKALTGMNASTFIRSIRLKAACQMLDSHPGIRISELAFQVGFNDPKYFSTCFKNEFGLLPTEYKNKSQESADVE